MKCFDIFSAVDFTDNDLIRFNALTDEEKKEVVKAKLVYQLSKYIIANFDNLPLNYKVEYSLPYTNIKESHIIRLNLISNEEVRKINDLEKLIHQIGGIIE